MAGRPSPKTVSTKQERIAQLAEQMPGVALTSLSHHIDIEWLKEAYRRTRKDGAVGVDGQTAREYTADLEGNLQSLLDRAKSGDHYRAPPVRRVYIPKGAGSQTRPIGIPTFEDKVLQRAAVMALGPVFEQDFLDCSYGFRPRRSAHDALGALWKHTMAVNGGWVLEADIEGFFDAVDHAQLREMFRRRVRDGVLVRLIGKWLKAGVLEEGSVYHPETGTPQGGVISPLLANIYLHEVLDVWFEQQVRPRLKGRAFLVRYADDFVMVFETKVDARRAAEAIRQVRIAPPPGKDAAGVLHQTAWWAQAARLGQRPPWQLRAAGLLSLLGPVPEGPMGGEAEDGLISFRPRPAPDRGLVQGEPAPAYCRSASSLECEVARA
jgi:RNA-directed DNA polymerase